MDWLLIDLIPRLNAIDLGKETRSGFIVRNHDLVNVCVVHVLGHFLNIPWETLRSVLKGEKYLEVVSLRWSLHFLNSLQRQSLRNQSWTKPGDFFVFCFDLAIVSCHVRFVTT